MSSMFKRKGLAYITCLFCELVVSPIIPTPRYLIRQNFAWFYLTIERVDTVPTRFPIFIPFFNAQVAHVLGVFVMLIGFRY